ncbi:hypothetical protein [Salidesulfovibrio onnuriiensis]|uniref:hypothetical protein n=1 Tax=Salidesulfovibrio onnuriiensis TaxID=2583823 RepID=UPI0011CC82AD|nr:hypothetical protein [Salidesulfovibrio onnuriiensis]
MGTVVALDQFRKDRDIRGSFSMESPHRPELFGSEIWGTDYSSVEGMVFGLLKVREIAGFFFGAHDKDFDHMLINALDKAYHYELHGHEALVAAIRPIKDDVADMINDDNRRPMSLALVILDLIEKSPARNR